jgi:hypothetical protein
MPRTKCMSVSVCVCVCVCVCVYACACACTCKDAFFKQLPQIPLQLNPQGTRGKINSLSSQFELFPQVNSVLSHHRRYFCSVMTNLLQAGVFLHSVSPATLVLYYHAVDHVNLTADTALYNIKCFFLNNRWPIKSRWFQTKARRLVVICRRRFKLLVLRHECRQVVQIRLAKMIKCNKAGEVYGLLKAGARRSWLCRKQRRRT